MGHSITPAEHRHSCLRCATALNAARSDKPDDKGDGLRGYNIVKNVGGKLKFVEHIDFDK